MNPELLKKKYRARPTAEQQETLHVKKYGQTIAADFVAGAEVLNVDGADDHDNNEDQASDESDGGEWVSSVLLSEDLTFSVGLKVWVDKTIKYLQCVCS